MAALLTAAARHSHQSPSADSNPWERRLRLGFFSVLGMCWGLACGLQPVAPPLHPLVPHNPVYKASRCYQLVFTFPIHYCWGDSALLRVTMQEDRDDAPSHVQGLPVLFLAGRMQTGEPGSPSIFMPGIHFHSFQYFMSITIKRRAQCSLRHSQWGGDGAGELPPASH